MPVPVASTVRLRTFRTLSALGEIFLMSVRPVKCIVTSLTTSGWISLNVPSVPVNLMADFFGTTRPLYFCDPLWPDFDEPELDAAIEHFGRRQRRFGLVPEQVRTR